MEMEKALILSAKEMDFLRWVCAREINDYETDGGVKNYYEAAKTLLEKLEAR
jgi:hypothetical protein